MRIFGTLLHAFRISRRVSCSSTTQCRYSSSVCTNFLHSPCLLDSQIMQLNANSRSFGSKSGNSKYINRKIGRSSRRHYDKSKSSESPATSPSLSVPNISNILPVALINANSHNASSVKILLIPINLFEGGDEAVEKTLAMLSIIRDNARQIEAFTDNLPNSTLPIKSPNTSNTNNNNTKHDENSNTNANNKANTNIKTNQNAINDTPILNEFEEPDEFPFWKNSDTFLDYESNDIIRLYDGLDQATAEHELNRINVHDSFDADSWNESKKDLYAPVPQNLEKNLQKLPISSMQLAFEMNMTNVKDALMMASTSSPKNNFEGDHFEQIEFKALKEPTLALTTCFESIPTMETKNVPLNFNALIQGTVEIDASKISSEQLSDIKVPEFNEYVTAMAANICSTALKKGFPADANRMSFCTQSGVTSSEPKKRNPHIICVQENDKNFTFGGLGDHPKSYSTQSGVSSGGSKKSPHIVCVRKGDKGCISPGLAQNPMFDPAAKGAATTDQAGTKRTASKKSNSCESNTTDGDAGFMSTSAIIGDVGARGLMSCKAYARALAEAEKRRASRKQKKDLKAARKSSKSKDKSACGDKKAQKPKEECKSSEKKGQKSQKNDTCKASTTTAKKPEGEVLQKLKTPVCKAEVDKSKTEKKVEKPKDLCKKDSAKSAEEEKKGPQEICKSLKSGDKKSEKKNACKPAGKEDKKKDKQGNRECSSDKKKYICKADKLAKEAKEAQKNCTKKVDKKPDPCKPEEKKDTCKVSKKDSCQSVQSKDKKPASAKDQCKSAMKKEEPKPTKDSCKAASSKTNLKKDEKKDSPKCDAKKEAPKKAEPCKTDQKKDGKKPEKKDSKQICKSTKSKDSAKSDKKDQCKSDGKKDKAKKSTAPKKEECNEDKKKYTCKAEKMAKEAEKKCPKKSEKKADPCKADQKKDASKSEKKDACQAAKSKEQKSDKCKNNKDSKPKKDTCKVTKSSSASKIDTKKVEKPKDACKATKSSSSSKLDAKKFSSSSKLETKKVEKPKDACKVTKSSSCSKLDTKKAEKPKDTCKTEKNKNAAKAEKKSDCGKDAAKKTEKDTSKDKPNSDKKKDASSGPKEECKTGQAVRSGCRKNKKKTKPFNPCKGDCKPRSKSAKKCESKKSPCSEQTPSTKKDVSVKNKKKEKKSFDKLKCSKTSLKKEVPGKKPTTPAKMSTSSTSFTKRVGGGEDKKNPCETNKAKPNCSTPKKSSSSNKCQNKNTKSSDSKKTNAEAKDKCTNKSVEKSKSTSDLKDKSSSKCAATPKKSASSCDVKKSTGSCGDKKDSKGDNKCAKKSTSSCETKKDKCNSSSKSTEKPKKSASSCDVKSKSAEKPKKSSSCSDIKKSKSSCGDKKESKSDKCAKKSKSTEDIKKNKSDSSCKSAEKPKKSATSCGEKGKSAEKPKKSATSCGEKGKSAEKSKKPTSSCDKKGKSAEKPKKSASSCDVKGKSAEKPKKSSSCSDLNKSKSSCGDKKESKNDKCAKKSKSTEDIKKNKSDSSCKSAEKPKKTSSSCDVNKKNSKSDCKSSKTTTPSKCGSSSNTKSDTKSKDSKCSSSDKKAKGNEPKPLKPCATSKDKKAASGKCSDGKDKKPKESGSKCTPVQPNRIKPVDRCNSKAKESKEASAKQKADLCPSTKATGSSKPKSTKPNCPKGIGGKKSGGSCSSLKKSFSTLSILPIDKDLFKRRFSTDTFSVLKKCFSSLSVGATRFFSSKKDKDHDKDLLDSKCHLFEQKIPKNRFTIKSDRVCKQVTQEECEVLHCTRVKTSDKKKMSNPKCPRIKTCEGPVPVKSKKDDACLTYNKKENKNLTKKRFSTQARYSNTTPFCNQNIQKRKLSTRAVKTSETQENIDDSEQCERTKKGKKRQNNEVIKIVDACQIETCPESIPFFSEYDVLIRTDSVALSGSDIHVYETGGKSAPGMTMGHDASGIVEEVGKCVTNLQPGDRVAIESGLSCGICDFCKRGAYNICSHLIHNGFLAKFQVHPADLCHKLPETVSMEDGCLAQILATGCQACYKAPIKPTSNVLIIGSCATAIAAALCARAIGASRICFMCSQESNLEMIRNQFDFDYVSYESDMKITDVVKNIYCYLQEWPDVVINCSISETTMNIAVMSLAPNGTCVLAECECECASFNALDVIMKNLKLMPSFRSTNMFPTALQLMECGQAPMHDLVVKTYSWDRVESAFLAALHQSNVGSKKVIIKCGEKDILKGLKT